MNPSAPMPGAPVAERGGVLRRHRAGAVEVEQHEEVVAQAVVLGQPHAAISLRRPCVVHETVAPDDGRRLSEPPASQQRRRRIGLGVEPGDAGVATEPGPLAAGEAPGAADRRGRAASSSVERRRRGGRAAPCSRGPGAAVRDMPRGSVAAAGAPRRGTRPPAAPRSGPRSARRRSSLPRRSADQAERRSAGGRRARGRSSRTAAAAHRHLEGPHDPPPVGRLHAAGGERVELDEPRVQRARVRSASSSARTSGYWPGMSRSSTTACTYSAGAADEQGSLAPAPRCRRGAARRLLEPGDGAVLPRVEQVEQVVRHLGPLGRRSAWRCRCPCPGTPASSRPTRAPRSGSRRASARARADFPDAVAPTRTAWPAHAGGVDRLGEAHGLRRVLVVAVGRDAVPPVALVERDRLGLGEAGLELEVRRSRARPRSSLERHEERRG